MSTLQTERKRITNFTKSRELSRRAQELIPAGCHTYSKGDDQFPENAPRFLERGAGCRVWDVDGNELLDWGMGLRSVILGYGHPRVLRAVYEQIERGTNFTRPAPVEVELAETLTELIPSAEMVKFAKNGSDVTTAAVRLARAFTGRDRVALCKEHPFFSFDDWFIGTTPPNGGIPQSVTSLSSTFHYNDLPSLERIFEEHPDEVACVIMEAATTEPPQPGFLEGVRALTRKHGALLILDEMITGFRWHLQGAQTYFGIEPDLCTFGKAMGNGFSVSALAGRRDVMELGGIRQQGQVKVFLLSATHGAETHSLAASRETLQELRDANVVEHLWSIGRKLQDGFNALASDLGLGDYVQCAGYPCSPYIVTRDRDRNVSLPLRTLFLQEMIARGVLIPYLAISYAHKEADVEETLAAADGALRVYRQALEEGVETYLVGPAVKPVFRRFN